MFDARIVGQGTETPKLETAFETAARVYEGLHAVVCRVRTLEEKLLGLTPEQGKEAGGLAGSNGLLNDLQNVCQDALRRIDVANAALDRIERAI